MSPLRFAWLCLPACLPAQGGWLATPAAPSGAGNPQLCFHEAAGRVFAVGRRNPLPLLETWEREGRTWRLVPTALAPSARSSYALGYDSARCRVVLFGGVDDRGTVLGDTWEWDGVDWSQRTVGIAPSPRYATAHAFDAARGRFVVYGGVWSSEHWEWDGVAWTQAVTGPTNPGVRGGASMTYDRARQALVLFGGSDGVAFAPRRDTWEFVGGAWLPRATALMPPALRGAVLAHDPDSGRSVLCGGRIADTFPSSVHTDVWDWDGLQWRVHAPATQPGERMVPGWTYDRGLQRFVSHGGFDGSDTWELDPSTWHWSRQVAVAPASRVALAVTDLGGGALWHSKDETMRWDFVTRRWQNLTTPVRPPAAGGVMAFDFVRQQALLSTADAQTWIWDDVGANWHRRHPAHTPPATRLGAMAFDPLRQRVVFYGGETSVGVSNQVWEWDGQDWADVTPTFGPQGRMGAAMAFDFGTGTAVMFGGARFANALAYENEVWDWDGSQWTQRAIVGAAPAGRYGAALLGDAQRILLLGGQVAPVLSGGMSDEVWELRGSLWVPLDRAPIACREPAAAADPITGDVVLFAGVVNEIAGSHVDPGAWTLGAPRASVAPFGHGCGGAAGLPRLSAVGLPQLANPGFALVATTGVPQAITAFAVGFAPRRTEVHGDCSVFLDVAAVRWTAATTAGDATLPLGVPAAPALLGLGLYAQAVVFGGPQAPVAFSGALRLVMGR